MAPVHKERKLWLLSVAEAIKETTAEIRDARQLSRWSALVNRVDFDLFRGEKVFTCVVELAAIIGCGKEGYQLTLGEELVAVLDHLMGTADQIEIMLGQEFRNDLECGWGETMKYMKHDVAVIHTSAPNVKLTPRSFSPQPMVSLSGSDHNKSHKRPWSGTSVGRMIRRICSMDWRSGLRPPWQQKIFSSTKTKVSR